MNGIQNCLSSLRNGVTPRSLVAGFFLHEEWRLLSSPPKYQPSETIATFDSVSRFPISSWSIAWSTPLSNTAACLHIARPLFFSNLCIFRLLSPMTEVPIEATDWDLQNDVSGVLEANLLLRLLPASSTDDKLSSIGSAAGAAMLKFLVLEEPAAADCCVVGWVGMTFWGSCAAGVAWLEVGLEVGWAGAVSIGIGLLNIVGAGAFAGIGAEGLVGATGCPGNNGLCCGALLELPVAAAWSALKISVPGNRD